jgi:septum formation protein
MMIKKKLILASRSPRRQLLLRQMGLDFEIRESGIDEVFDTIKSFEANVMFLSEQKALHIARSVDDAIIIGADTIVVLDKHILGKPSDAQDASKMLTRLSGRIHEVYTGFTLFDRPSNQSMSAFEVTKVKFRVLLPDEIAEYVNSGSPMDKAGAYGIQDDYGAVFVEKVDGCFYNVVGFPLTKFYTTLQQFQKQLGIG